MNQLLSSFDAIASKLPLDGNKTLAFMSIKAFLPLVAGFFPGFQPVAASAVLNSLLDAGIALSAAHKAAKFVIQKDPK